MIEKVHGIVLDVVKHNDRNNIVTLFTRERGRVACLSGVGNGRSARLRNARLMPLSVIESDINFQGNKSLQLLREFESAEVWRDLYYNPVKGSIVMFIAEFLHKYLRESHPDGVTYDFIVASLRVLDEMERGVSNFHIWFLVHFLHLAGICPDLSNYEEGDLLDMEKGELVPGSFPTRTTLSAADTRGLQLLFRISSRNMHRFRLNGGERSRILNLLLRYYALHFPGLGNFKTLDILHSLFV